MAETPDVANNNGSLVEEGSYDAGDIKKLDFPEAIRKRPGMYVGGANENGLHHCVYEALDNSVDEPWRGTARRSRFNSIRMGQFL